METLWKDFHYGLRMLRRNYGLTAIAALSLALGIGATSAIFSVINAVMLRPLHYRDPDRLVMIYEHFLKNGHDRIKVAPNNFLDWQKSNRVFEEIGAAYMPEQKTISASWGEPEQVLCYLVTYNFFPLLGVEAYLGRTFTPQEDAPYKVGEEESPHGDRVVLLSYGIWQRRFGADPAIIGKTVQIDRVGHTVVGVMPPGFRFLDQPADVWVPLGLDPAKDYRAKFGRFLAVPARLKPGVTVQQAHDEMRAIGDQLARQFPGYNKGWTANVVPIEKQVIGNIGNTLWVLFGAVFFVLLIACANVASLRLAQGAAREKEMAIRASLGAGRLRLLVLLLIENIMLSGLGGALGLLLAFYLVKVLVALGPSNIPRLTEINLDLRVVAFTCGLSFLVGIISGLVPALQISRIDLNATLKEGGRSTAPGVSSKYLRGSFVVAEFALAVVLLIGAGLLIRSFLRLQAVDPGFNTKNLLTMRIQLPVTVYAEGKRRTEFFEHAIKRIDALPGVQSASTISHLPFSGTSFNTFFMIEGIHGPNEINKPTALIRPVSSNFFRTMGIPLLMGREFTERDITADDANYVIINETIARRWFPNQNPVGRRLRINRPEEKLDEIIGVAADIKIAGIEDDVLPTIYWPHHRWPTPTAILLMRTTVDPLHLNGAVTREIHAIDAGLSVADVRTMDDALWSSVGPQRFYSLLLTVFAGVALLLAIMGIYGAMSYAVTQRRHEIGVRMALGAQKGDVINLILRNGMALTLIGVVIGLVASYALTRFLSIFLYGVKPTDPLTFAGVTLLLSVVALLACFIPAKRATKVDPIMTLRHE